MFSKTAHRFDSGGAKSVQFVTDNGLLPMTVNRAEGEQLQKLLAFLNDP